MRNLSYYGSSKEQERNTVSLYRNKTQEHKWSLLERFLSLLISRPYVNGPTSVVNFERVMEGTRSLAK